MMYTCSQCGRIMDYPEALSFCPFCAAAYDRAELESPAPPAQPLRIVIDSDSPSAIQKKYWQLARMSFIETLDLLLDQVVDQEVIKPIQLAFSSWFNEQHTVRSGMEFKRRCDDLIEKIRKALTTKEAIERNEIIDLNAKAGEINSVCLRLAEAMGCEAPHALLPALKYAEEGMYETAPIQIVNKSVKAELELLEAVLRVKPVFYRALDEGGIYIAFAGASNEADAETEDNSPAKLAQKLDLLARKDYDPLFGEQYDDFIAAFWMSVKVLADAVNKLHQLPKIDNSESAKYIALKGLADEWAEALDMALDRTYQKGQMNMIYVYSDVTSICKEIEALGEEKPTGSDEEKD